MAPTLQLAHLTTKSLRLDTTPLRFRLADVVQPTSRQRLHQGQLAIRTIRQLLQPSR